MGKRVAFMPLETVTFVMNDENGNPTKEIDFTFNNYALMTITEEFGDLNKLFNKFKTKPYDVAAILLYGGAKGNNTEFTIEEARAIVASGGSTILNEVSRLVIESLMILGGDDAKKKFISQMKAMKIIQ